MCIGITNLYNQKTGKIISIKLFITEKEYNEVEYIVSQTSYQNGEVIYQVSYHHSIIMGRYMLDMMYSILLFLDNH